MNCEARGWVDVSGGWEYAVLRGMLTNREKSDALERRGDGREKERTESADRFCKRHPERLAVPSLATGQPTSSARSLAHSPHWTHPLAAGCPSMPPEPGPTVATTTTQGSGGRGRETQALCFYSENWKWTFCASSVRHQQDTQEKEKLKELKEREGEPCR